MTQLRAFTAALEALELGGPIPDGRELSSSDREALRIAEQLFAERAELAPPLREWSSEARSQGQVVARIGPSAIEYPSAIDDSAVAGAALRSQAWAHWLSGGVAAAVLVGFLLLTGSLAQKTAPTSPQGASTPAGMGLTVPTPTPSTELPERNGIAPFGPADLRTATRPAGPAESKQERAAPSPSTASSQGASAPAASTNMPPEREPAIEDKAPVNKKPATQAAPAATDQATTMPQASATALLTAPPTQDPPPASQTPRSEPPPIQTMAPLPTEPSPIPTSP